MNINKVQTTDTSTITRNPSLINGIDPAETSGGTNDVKALEKVEKSNKSTEQTQSKDAALSAKEAKEIAEDLNEYMDDLQTHLGFSIREDLNKTIVVEIKNRKTQELIKQIPSEELLKIMENMKELQGIIFDQSV